MNELTRKIHGIFRPKAALIAYECGEGYSRDSYLELRPINENGRMGAAVPVSYDFMNALVENYSVRTIRPTPAARRTAGCLKTCSGATRGGAMNGTCGGTPHAAAGCSSRTL